MRIVSVTYTLGLAAAAAKTSASDEKVNISGENALLCLEWSGDVHNTVECKYNNNNNSTRAGSFIANSV